MGHGAEYRELIVFLATAGVIAPLFARLKVSPILGYLIAGAALGPQGLGRAAGIFPAMAWIDLGRPEELKPLAELGVVFLLFVIGLELSWERLKTMRRLVVGLGLAQVVVCTILIAGAAVALGQPPAAALVLGAAFALSSTALVIPSLAERRRLTSAAGRASLSILLAQDLAVAPILVTLGLAAGMQGAGAPTGALLSLLPAAAALVALLAAGRWLLRPLFHSAARAKSSDMFAAASLLIVVGAAAAAAAGGLSMGLGAFVAGLLLAETEFRREVEVVVDPFKGLLLGMFFVSVGAELDLKRLASEPLTIAAIAAATAAGKAAAVYGLGRVFGLRRASAGEAALPLGPAGEFAFVVLAQASAARLIGTGAADTGAVAAGLGLFAVPALASLGARLGKRAPAAEHGFGLAHPEPEEGRRVLVVGYGRVGRLVGEMLGAHQIEFTAIDADPAVAAAARGQGARVYFGDAAREGFLMACGLERAPAVVVTMDAPAKVNEVVRTVRKLRPDITLIARARDARHAAALYRLGVTDAVPEAVEASLQLAENTLVDLGVPMGLVIASIHEKRDGFRRLFAEEATEPRPVRALRRREAP
ncbi:MAG: cation:proton antiporter [Caulobacteraceae bacterium]|nr:cation:proton antiporter [Caulobacteraceae bacterium]